MYKISNFLWGTILIIIGLIFGLNALEITNVNIFFRGWWTLFIIVPNFIDLFKDKNKIGSIVGLLIGIVLLLSCNNIIDFNLIWKLIVPISLILIGLSFIFKDALIDKAKKEIKRLNSQDINEYYATFGKQELDFSKEKFQGCSLNSIFGEIKCNIKESNIEKDTIINATSIFGGITLLVPENINIKIVSTSIFGDVSDERTNKNKDSKNTLYINALCMFGGVKIK